MEDEKRKLKERIAQLEAELQQYRSAQQKSATSSEEESDNINDVYTAKEKKRISSWMLTKIGDFTFNFLTQDFSCSKDMYELIKYDGYEKFNLKIVNEKIHHPDDIPIVTNWLQDAIDKKSRILPPLEYRLICKDKTIIYVRAEGTIEYQNGEAVRLFGICEDITEKREQRILIQKKNEELKRQNEEIKQKNLELTRLNLDLQKSKEKLRFILNSVNDAVGFCKISKTQIGNFIEVNNKACELSGYTKEELYRLTPADVLHHERLKNLRVVVQKTLSEDIFHIETKLTCKSGEIKNVDVNTTAFDFAGEKYITITARDITKHKRAEQELRTSEARFQTIAEHIPGAIYQFVARADGSYSIPFISKGGEKIFEKKLHEITDDKVLFEGLHPDDSVAFFASIEESMQKLTTWIHEFRLLKESGIKWLRGSATPQKNSDGSIIWNGILLDITPRKKAEQTLVENEEKFRLIFQNAVYGIATADSNGILTNANPAFCKMLGYTLQELSGKSFLQLTDKKYHNSELELVNKVRKGEIKNYSLEKEYITKNRGNIWVRIAVATNHKDNKILGYIASAVEITEKKEAEQKLRYERYLFDTLMNTIPENLYFKNLKCRFIKINKHLSTYLGLDSPEQAIGKSDFDFFSNEHAQQAYKDELEIIETGIPLIGFEEKETWPDGHISWVSTTKMPLKDKNDKTIGTFGISRDITDRRAAQLALAQSEERFRTLITHMDEGVILFDKHRKIVMYNKASQHILATEKIEFAEQQMEDYMFPVIQEDGSKLPVAQYPAMITLREKRTVKDKIIGVIKSKDTISWIKMNSIPVFFTEKEDVYALTTFTDITELKEKEQKLSEANATKDKFFSIIAHDLKNPFNSIVNFSELLKRRIEQGEKQKAIRYAHLLHQTSQQAMDLLINLLEWSRSQTGRIIYSPQTFELMPVIQDVIELLENSAYEKQIHVFQAMQPDLYVYADENMIHTVIRNLLSNAIKFTRIGGKIIVSTIAIGDKILIEVRDNGVGIKPDDLQNLFTVGKNRSTPGTNSEEGTGLGLIICNDFIEKNNSKLNVESKPDKGSTFSFMLPTAMDTTEK